MIRSMVGTGLRRWVTRNAGWRLWLVAVAVLPTGCSVRDDPGYNVYNSGEGRPAVLSTVDEALERAHEAVNDLDRRAENAVY